MVVFDNIWKTEIACSQLSQNISILMYNGLIDLQIYSIHILHFQKYHGYIVYVQASSCYDSARRFHSKLFCVIACPYIINEYWNFSFCHIPPTKNSFT